VVVPALLFALCFLSSLAVAVYVLPPLAPGAIGKLAYGIAINLLAAAVAVMALEVYELIRVLVRYAAGVARAKPDILASGIAGILRDSGALFAAGAIVYLLGPRSYRA
jgi:hypothetical protein